MNYAQYGSNFRTLNLDSNDADGIVDEPVLRTNTEQSVNVETESITIQRIREEHRASGSDVKMQRKAKGIEKQDAVYRRR